MRDCPYCTWPMKELINAHVYICDNYGCSTDMGDGSVLKPCLVVPKVERLR